MGRRGRATSVRTLTPYLLKGDFSFHRSAQLPTRSSTHQNSGLLVQVLIQSKAALFSRHSNANQNPRPRRTPSTTITSGKRNTHCRFRIFRDTTHNCGTFADNKWAWVTAGRIEDPLLNHLHQPFELRTEDSSPEAQNNRRPRTSVPYHTSTIVTTPQQPTVSCAPQHISSVGCALSAIPPQVVVRLIPACLVRNEHPSLCQPRALGNDAAKLLRWLREDLVDVEAG